jgi:hypothetical protein
VDQLAVAIRTVVQSVVAMMMIPLRVVAAKFDQAVIVVVIVIQGVVQGVTSPV